MCSGTNLLLTGVDKTHMESAIERKYILILLLALLYLLILIIRQFVFPILRPLIFLNCVFVDPFGFDFSHNFEANFPLDCAHSQVLELSAE